MKKFNSRLTTKFAKMAFAILAMCYLAACGASNKSNDSFGSTTLGSTDPNNAIATCSKDVTGLSDLEVHLEQYVDQYGQSRNDLVRLQFKKAPTAWQTNNWDMQIYRWAVAPNGTSTIDPAALQYQFEVRNASGFQIISGGYQYVVFDWADTVQMGASAGISTASPQSFWTAANLLVNLRDSTNTYQVLRVVFRDQTTHAEVASYQINLLIPSFEADPAVYAADTVAPHPASLQALHPLKSLLGQNWSQANYTQFAQAFCF